MSLGKLPAIKGLVSTSHSKRRFKSELSVDMISPPLGDFRHTMHVGRGGDVFGDTSFLSNHGGSSNDGEPEDPSSPSGSKPTRFISRTLRHVRKNPPPRLRGGSRDFSPTPPPISPIIKNAISLPQLHLDAPNGGLTGALLPTSTSSPADSLYSYGLHSGFSTLPCLSRFETFCTDHRRSSVPENGGISLTRSDSLTSFTVDLGPSLMSEVMEMIDSSCSVIRSSQDEEREEEDGSQQEEDTEEEDTEEEDTEEEDSPTRPSADASVRCPVRAEMGIEPARFQLAANMLARHFGGGGVLKDQQRAGDEHHRPSSFSHRRASYHFPESEEEIKV